MYVYTVLANPTGGISTSLLFYAFILAGKSLNIRSYAMYVYTALANPTGGISTSLLFSAFESWVVGEHLNRGYDPKWLGDTFSKVRTFVSTVQIVDRCEV